MDATAAYKIANYGAVAQSRATTLPLGDERSAIEAAGGRAVAFAAAIERGADIPPHRFDAIARLIDAEMAEGGLHRLPPQADEWIADQGI